MYFMFLWVLHSIDKCPEGWVSFEDSCYKLETTSQLQQENSARHCKNQYNGILSVMNSREEAIHVSNYIKGVSVCIIS
mgnify:FL=1